MVFIPRFTSTHGVTITKSIPAVGRGGGLPMISWQETSVAASPNTAINNEGTAIVKHEKEFANLRN